MINKTKLVDFIGKYYLNGLTEDVKYTIKDKTMNVQFKTFNRDVIGSITSPIDLDDAEFAITDSSPFLKLLNILDKDIQIEYQSEYGIIEKLLIEDNQYKMLFVLGDISQVKPVERVIDNINFNLTYNIEPDFSTKFIECKKALGSEIKTFQLIVKEDNKAKIILGDPSGYANKLEFEIDVNYEGFPFEIDLNSDIVKEILVANKNYTSGEMRINPNGLFQLYFVEDDVTSMYSIPVNNENNLPL